MIPIRDTVPSQRRPFVVYALVAANAWAFLRFNMALPPGALHDFFTLHGIVPAHYSDPLAPGGGYRILPFFTSMFLHGGLMHFLGNMWTLWIFGDNVEDWFGHWGFLAFYVFCGLASGAMHLVANWSGPGSQLPTIGASGAIAGVMGAYFLLYPKARVLTLLPIFIFIQFVELPAYVFLGFWFLLQFLSGTASLAGQAGGIAWWAHIGGFVAGAAIVFVLGGAKPRRPTRARATMKPLWKKVDDYWGA